MLSVCSAVAVCAEDVLDEAELGPTSQRTRRVMGVCQSLKGPHCCIYCPPPNLAVSPPGYARRSSRVNVAVRPASRLDCRTGRFSECAIAHTSPARLHSNACVGQKNRQQRYTECRNRCNTPTPSRPTSTDLLHKLHLHSHLNPPQYVDMTRGGTEHTS